MQLPVLVCFMNILRKKNRMHNYELKRHSYEFVYCFQGFFTYTHCG